MRKRSLCTLITLLCFSLVMIGQQDADPNVVITEGKTSKRLMKVVNPETDKTDLADITGISGTTFTTSNTADGTSNSYKHYQKIIVSLVSSGNKSNSFQLVFFSTATETAFAAEVSNGMYSIYFPVSMYGEIREKLEQAFAARKKVQVKLVQGKNGYREGTLLL